MARIPAKPVCQARTRTSWVQQVARCVGPLHTARSVPRHIALLAHWAHLALKAVCLQTPAFANQGSRAWVWGALPVHRARTRRWQVPTPARSVRLQKQASPLCPGQILQIYVCAPSARYSPTARATPVEQANTSAFGTATLRVWTARSAQNLEAAQAAVPAVLTKGSRDCTALPKECAQMTGTAALRVNCG